MDVERLLAVKAAILAEPDAFRMDMWSCGTAHCIGGWAVVLAGLTFQQKQSPNHQPSGAYLSDGRWTSSVAAQLLDLKFSYDDDFMTPQSLRLLDVHYWPSRFKTAYRETTDHRERAQIAAERIDHFVATEGRE